MTQWNRLKDIVAAALERPEPERAAYLEGECAGDDALRAEAESLLAGATAASGFLEPPPPPPADQPREHIGVYRILEELGHGGMGTVYRAERQDGGPRRKVAIKVIRRGLDTDSVRRRFHRESHILAGLEHPGIARLYDGGTTEDGLPYFVMEAIDGTDLLSYCDQRRLPTVERVRLFLGVCDAVRYAHQHLVVHRDLKPSNVLVTADGVPKLLDFGLARLLDPAADPDTADLSALEPRFFTPEYASPEQVNGGLVTTSSDVYSLGVMLYELLTGHRPYRLKDRSLDEARRVVGTTNPERPSSVVARIATSPGPANPGDITPASVSLARDCSPSRLRRALAGDLDNIVLKALRKDPERRYGSVEALSDDLQRSLDGLPVRARRDTVAYRLRKFLGRHRVEAAATTLLVLVIAGYTVSLSRERDRSRREAEKATQVAHFLTTLFAAADPNQSTGAKLTADQLLARGATRVADELGGQPELEATMLDTIGGVETQMSLYEQARPHLEQALALRRRVSGEESLETAQSTKALGLLLHLTGKFVAARPLLEQALAIQERRLGPNSIEVARTLSNLGNTLKASADFKPARAAFERAIAICERQGDPNSVDLAKALNNFGLLLLRIPEPGQAATAFRRALAIHEHNQGPSGAMVAGTLQNLVTALRLSGESRAALPLLERSIALTERTYGKQHRVYANGLSERSDLLLDLGELDRAAVSYRECIAAFAAMLGPQHPDGSYCVRGLGEIAERRGDLPTALRSFQDALAMREHGLAAGDPVLATSLDDVGQIETRIGRPATAEPLLRRALAIDRKALAADSDATARVEARLAEALAALGQRDEARRLFIEALAVLHAHLSKNATTAGRVEQELAALDLVEPRGSRR